MAGGLVEQAWAAQHRAALGICGGEHQAADAGVTDGAGAHGARLQGDEQGKAGQAVVAARLGRGAQGEDFGVRGGVVGGNWAVAGRGEHLAGGRIDDNRADRRLAAGGGGLRLGEGATHHHEVMVGHREEPNGPPASGQVERAASDGERIAKVLARAGVASRREVERLIADGRVRLNGEVLATPAVKVGPADAVTVDGAPVAAAEPTRLFRYHKPAGLVTTHRDPAGRPTVFDALPPGLPRLISVGRLDLASEGLLLLTNDGALARALELPATGLARRYRARARGRIDQARLDGLREGLVVDGVRYGAIEARLDKSKGGETGATSANLWISLALAEGKNREVRRVLEALGLTVNRLIRLAYGPFALGELAAGAVEEVGPRVLREQLGQLIAPASLPTGDRALWRPPRPATPARSARRPEPAEPAVKRKAYKPGWARPKASPRRAPGSASVKAAPARPRRPPPGGAGPKGGRPPR